MPGFVLLKTLCLLASLHRGHLSTPCSAHVNHQFCCHRAAPAAILQCNRQQQSPLLSQQRHRAGASARRASRHRGCLNPITTRRPRAAHRPMRQLRVTQARGALASLGVRRSVPSSKRAGAVSRGLTTLPPNRRNSRSAGTPSRASRNAFTTRTCSTACPGQDAPPDTAFRAAVCTHARTSRVGRQRLASLRAYR